MGGDYLSRLGNRRPGAPGAVRPRLTSRFEPRRADDLPATLTDPRNPLAEPLELKASSFAEETHGEPARVRKPAVRAPRQPSGNTARAETPEAPAPQPQTEGPAPVERHFDRSQPLSPFGAASEGGPRQTVPPRPAGPARGEAESGRDVSLQGAISGKHERGKPVTVRVETRPARGGPEPGRDAVHPQRREKTQQEPVIQVTIGRLEVRAAGLQPAATQPAPEREGPHVMTLAAYLQRREERGR